jgi:uncharacterized protein (DUF1499 family)
MTKRRTLIGWLLGLLLLLALGAGGLWALAARSRSMTAAAGIDAGRLLPCPATPNCVCSDTPRGDSHYVAPIAAPADTDWAEIVAAVAAMDGARIQSASEGYAHFTFASGLFGFIDDVELHARPDSGEIAVRSASRVGKGDLNANRRRVEAIRTVLSSL